MDLAVHDTPHDRAASTRPVDRIFGPLDLPAEEWRFAQPLFDLSPFEYERCCWCRRPMPPAALEARLVGMRPQCKDHADCELHMDARFDALLDGRRSQEVAA